MIALLGTRLRRSANIFFRYLPIVLLMNLFKIGTHNFFIIVLRHWCVVCIIAEYIMLSLFVYAMRPGLNSAHPVLIINFHFIRHLSECLNGAIQFYFIIFLFVHAMLDKL